MNEREMLTGVFGIFVVAILLFLAVWGVGVLFTSADQDYWEQIDHDCYVHVVKVNNAWLTKGHSEPTVRTTYCKTELRGVQ